MLIAGRYRLHDPIGRGAMGEVWRGVDETLGRPVAVKLLLPHDSDPTATSRFRLEAQTAGRLNHPYVVGVYDFGEYDGRLFLVMELVDGDSLARRLSTGGPLPAGQVARIATQAAAGLAAAHQQGIVHRDIKPANLLLDADGTLKIGDFGIARFVDDPSGALTTTGQIVGTSLYLAPERALGQPAGPACDVYALGCVLYQLLTGRPPFQADSAVAILHQHLDSAPVPPRQLGVLLPPAFENYLLGLLAKQPEDRPTAQRVAEWFGGGAWQGRPEPLPAPAAVPAVSAMSSVSARTASPAPVFPVPAETGPPTTYALPSTAGRAASRPRAARRPQGPAVRGAVRRRPRVAGIVAGVVVFLAAMLAGMLFFAPGRSTADSPGDTAPGTTAPAPTPSAAPSGAAALPVVPAPSPTVAVTAATREEQKGDKKQRAGNKGPGKGGEDDRADGGDGGDGGDEADED
ncbi:serine/threonine-protein kinase [Streptomyces cellulosae]|uniref:serine/threonine-protein kinase n=1 Tax=Streptomyces cellulosae TaxID=1968 RepID=UPI0004CA6B69|nr:serine/threonine-protein kinase [Streptomyces cellulosae]